MRVAIIGKGKTGQAVIDSLDPTQITDIYCRKNLPTITSLKKAEVAIVFVPQAAIMNLYPVLLAAQIPVICGATNVPWPKNFSSLINKAQVPWVIGNNFSISMYFIRRCLLQLKDTKKFLNANISIHETHHIDKKDCPSGTALSWKEWMGLADCPITSQRIFDVKGEHLLKITTPFETITLSHIAHDRRLFAEGAIWAAQQITQHQLKPKLYQFADLLELFFPHEMEVKR